MERAGHPIAIVGIGCRLPPAASSLAAFWKFLNRGGNALRAIRADRWDWRQFYDADPNRPGKSYAPKAATLDQDLRQFDPLAFGISPREAASLDPQQRLLLEVTWEAFEDAGMPLSRLAGSLTGVFVGGFCLDYLLQQTQPSNRHLINAHSTGGVMMTVLSNRLSHAFDLRGPSLTLDTACSSSLVALHYACQSLRARECDLALAGGVNTMLRPEYPIIMSKGHFLSPHGECHAFDETAAGYARGEGAGILLLKRLDDALADGDRVHAVIRASGVNQDGHTDGISLPNSEAQHALVQQIYRDAGVPFAEVDYVEAHGTGTQAGDFAELAALDRNFSQGRTKKLLVGSVKTNVGHLEAAAGMAGMLKTIGILQHRQVPKNLHFKNPNPRIPFADYTLEIASETARLASAEEKPTLFAAVNSFGYGGTNAHVLLESAPVVEAPSATEEGSVPRLMPFSACSEEALRDLAGKFAFSIGQGLPGSLADLAYTIAFRRNHLASRLAVLAGGPDELRERLIAVSTGQPHEAVATGNREAISKLVFVYTGMGPQWWRMGQELMRSEPIVAEAVEEVDGHFRKLAGWSLRDAMLATESESRMAHTELAQPANFALQVALTRLWESHGIRPDAVVGHSVGEVSSAYVAGVHTLEEAVRVSYHRSRLQQTAAGRGAMLAVGLPEVEALQAIGGRSGVSIAAINSFSAVTLSGDTEPLEEIAADLEARGVFHKFLRVEVAYHSPQMEPLREELLAALADLSPKPAQRPLYSTAHGGIIPGEAWDAEYWWRNVRQPVRFAEAMRRLMEDGFSAFLEIGPHPVLGNSIKECGATLGRKVTCFTSLRRAEPERARFLLTVGELYCAGIDVNWSRLAPSHGRFIPGPQYPWQRQAHWIESERSKMERLGLPGPVYLNRSVLAPHPTWEVEINRNFFPFLPDHGVQDQTVFAGMGYIEAALALSQHVHGKPAVGLENVSFEKVLIVEPAKLQQLVTEFDAEAGRFSIYSRVEGEEESGQRHCRGRMFPLSEPGEETLDVEALRARCAGAVDPDKYYEHLAKLGLRYGPTFRPTTEILGGDGCFFLRLRAVENDDQHPLHPSLFDAALQGVIYFASEDELFVPSSFETFEYLFRPEGAECVVFGEFLARTETRIVADLWLADVHGRVHARAARVALQRIETDGVDAGQHLFYDVTWKPSPLERPERIDGAPVVVLADAADSDLAGELARELGGSIVAELPDSEFSGHLIVLWGSRSGAQDVGAISALNEKAIELLKRISGSPVDVTFVTRGAKSVQGEPAPNLAATSFGALGLVAENEFEPIACRVIDLDSSDSAAQIIAEIAAGSRGEIAYREGQRFVSVLGVREPAEKEWMESPVDEPVALRVGARGRLDSLGYEFAERVPPGEGEIEIRVHRVSLNYKDLLKVEGRLHPLAFEGTYNEATFGMECAGIVTRSGTGSRFQPGDRVVALMRDGFRSYVTTTDDFAFEIPENMGMDAAAVPVVYMAAYRGLVEVANLQPGERVLIHHGTGGVGLAAIDIARWKGAEIFATAGSEEKRAWLREQGITRVFSSRDLDFAPQIREATAREGVDVVIGAQSGQALHASLGLLRAGGRYVEIGKKDIVEDNGLPLRPFNQNLIFASVDMDRLMKERPEMVRKTLAAIFAHFAAGDFQPGPVRTFPASEIEMAFHEMARSRHVGKLLVDFSTGGVKVPARPEPLVHRDGCYIVTGGTSGFGVTTAQWLAEKGAGRILLVSRSGPAAPGIAEVLSGLEARGAQAEALSVDVTDPQQVKELFERAGSGAFQLRGVVHGAMVLDDAMMSEVTPERFRRVFLPKAGGALHLAEAARNVPSLDFLVFYSSVSALVGNRGQTSYVAANALLDGLAHALRAQGMPALSISWGALAESGVVARDEHIEAILSSSGITGLGNKQALDALEVTMRQASAQTGIFLVDWEQWGDAHPKLATQPRFRGLCERAQSEGGDLASQIRLALAECSKEQRLRALEDHLQDVLAGTLKMAKDLVPMNRRVNELGVDSLLVLELSLGIKERIGVNFSAMEFLKGPTLQELASMAEGKLWNNGVSNPVSN